MTFGHILLILFVGVFAGFLNTVAGGGSLLTMPALIFIGLPSAIANGTNRIALLIQNFVAVVNFRRKGYFDWRFSLLIGIPAVIGSIIGARFAISLSDTIFNKILAVIMVVVLIFILWQPHKKLLRETEMISTKRKIIAAITFLFVGFYGGFIQAGVGFIIIASLALITGMSLVKINSIKVFVIGVYMLSSLAVFIYHGEINWILGLTMAIGNSVGAWLGSNFAVAKSDKWIRLVLVIAVTVMAIKLFFF